MGSNPKSLTITFTYSYLVVHNLQINHSRYCKIYIRKHTHTHKHTLTEGRGRYACKSNFYNVTTNQTLESAKYKLTKMFRYFLDILKFFFYFYVQEAVRRTYILLVEKLHLQKLHKCG